MGTNYYLVETKPQPCPTCGHTSDYTKLHIGKSSGGWCFALHVSNALGPRIGGKAYAPETWEAWKALLAMHAADGAEARWKIQDENGSDVTYEEIVRIVEDRSWRPGRLDGLGRSSIDGVHCVGHGKGTWDLIVGEFS